MKQWIFLVGAIVSEVAATLSLKAGMENPLFYIIVAVGYAAAFIFLTKALKMGMARGVAGRPAYLLAVRRFIEPYIQRTFNGNHDNRNYSHHNWSTYD